MQVFYLWIPILEIILCLNLLWHSQGPWSLKEKSWKSYDNSEEKLWHWDSILCYCKDCIIGYHKYLMYSPVFMSYFPFLFSLLVTFVKYPVLTLIFVIKISSYLILEFIPNTTKYYLNNMAFSAANKHSTGFTCT